jgi:ubiquinone/menaquinone biosynthesis C-methylase UbiE
MYLYFAPDLRRAGVVEDASLAAMTERHHIALTPQRLDAVSDASAAIARSDVGGAVFELSSGLPSRRHLELIDRLLHAGRRVWLFWPAERAVECVDAERLDSLRRLRNRAEWLKRIGLPIVEAAKRWERVPTGLRWIYRGEFPVRRLEILDKLTLLTARAQPVPLDDSSDSDRRLPFRGVGLYLREDFWNEASHESTRRAVAELAAVTDRVVCLTASGDASLGECGVQQVAMDAPRSTSGQDAIVAAAAHYQPIVKAACQALQPTYLYERLSAGQWVGAELSQQLGIPYIVEYPGTDAALHEALNGTAPFYPELYAKAEELALRQATVIVLGSSRAAAELTARGIDARRMLVVDGDCAFGARLRSFVSAQARSEERTTRLETGDSYKDQVQVQWNENPAGSHHARRSQPHTLEWFLEVETHRYGTYAPWMPETMEFAKHAGHDVLEIGGGLGTDLAQFASNGARVTDVDLAAGHLQLAEKNFALRGLVGRFVHHDAECLPFPDESFDLVYSNGVLHHTPNTSKVVSEIHRVLRRGGRAIVMLYAEQSLHYWRKLVWELGVRDGLLDRMSMGDIMSRAVERTSNEARPLVKVYTKARARALFENFTAIEVLQRQLQREELPDLLKSAVSFLEPRVGWNLIVKAAKHR